MVKEIHIVMNDEEFFKILKIKEKLANGNKLTWKEFIMRVENGK